MRLDLSKIKEECRRRGVTLSELLERAGVSRNAFYSLARRDFLMPRSLRSVAAELHLTPSAILVDEEALLAGMRELQQRVDGIIARNPDCDRDNARHTLLLLREEPVERLRRALRRARA